MELGRRVEVLRMAKDPDRGRSGLGEIECAFFPLFGLLIAFTFSWNASRSYSRRELPDVELRGRMSKIR